MKRYISFSVVTAILLLIVGIISCEEKMNLDSNFKSNSKIETKTDVLNELKNYIGVPSNKVILKLQNKGSKFTFYSKGKLIDYDTYDYFSSNGSFSYIICVEDSIVTDAYYCITNKKIDSVLSSFSYWEKRLQDFELKNKFYAKILGDNSFNNTYNKRASFIDDFNKKRNSLAEVYEEIEGNIINAQAYFLYNRNKNKAISYVGFYIEDVNDFTNSHSKIIKDHILELAH